MKEANGMIVYDVDVYNLPPYKAEALVERLLDKLISKRPDGWFIVVQPVRHKENRVQVFSFTGEMPKSIPPIEFDSKELILITGEVKPDQLRDYALLMLGAPVLKISDEVKEFIDELVEKAFKYEINQKQKFVYEMAKEWVKVVDGEVIIDPDA